MADTLEGRLTDCLAQAATDGLIDDDVAMVTDWLLVASTILDDGDTGTLFTCPADQPLTRALGLVGMADVMVREAVRDWLAE